MAKLLGLDTVTAEDGCVVFKLIREKGREFELRASPFGVATIVSAIHSARALALLQLPTNNPELMTQIQAVSLLSNDEAGMMCLRIQVNEFHYHDYVTGSDSPLARALQVFSDELQREMQKNPDASWSVPSKN